MRIIKKIKYPITIILLIVVAIYLVLIKTKLNNSKYDNSTKEEEILVKENEKIEEPKEICSIDIKGAVNNPGVYNIDCNSNVNDAIKIAGNLTKDADTSIINLAKKITNEMVIIIYTKEEIKNSNIVDTVIKVVEKECVCPNIQNDGCINDEINENIGETNLININTASISDLQNLPGIGESKAKSIVEYREKNGNYNTIEDLLNVSGIGEKLYEEIKAYITT